MPAYPDDADGAVLAQLAEAGVDMSQPLQIEFVVAVPNEASATAVQKALSDARYEASIEYDEGEPDEDGVIDPDDEEFGPCWTVYVNTQMVPDYDEIVRVQADLDRLSKVHDGYSDGWGVMLDEASDE